MQDGGRGEGRAEDALQDGEGHGPDDLPGGGEGGEGGGGAEDALEDGGRCQAPHSLRFTEDPPFYGRFGQTFRFSSVKRRV
jgi:hypothetical protein